MNQTDLSAKQRRESVKKKRFPFDIWSCSQFSSTQVINRTILEASERSVASPIHRTI